MDKRNFLERLFPVKYDFNDMLSKQADVTAEGVRMLLQWLEDKSESKFQQLIRCAKKADSIRFDMESKLIEAFVTPFNREDIYSFSVEMDKIIEFARTTVESMKAFEVEPDDILITMTEKLSKGMDFLSESIKKLKKTPLEAEGNIKNMREMQLAVEDYYRKGMAIQFKNKDTINALKYREIYHHVKDAASYLGYTVDIFHKIVVRVV